MPRFIGAFFWNTGGLRKKNAPANRGMAGLKARATKTLNALGEEAAIDGIRLAGAEGGGIARQEDRHADELIHVADATHRSVADDRRQALRNIERLGVEWRAEDARRDRVDAYSLRGPLAPQTLGQHVDAGLARAVDGDFVEA